VAFAMALANSEQAYSQQVIFHYSSTFCAMQKVYLLNKKILNSVINDQSK
jgi:hypothetical protein